MLVVGMEDIFWLRAKAEQFCLDVTLLLALSRFVLEVEDWRFGAEFSSSFFSLTNSKRRSKVARADGQHLPYRSGVFDTVVCAAVVHHFASEARRLRAIAELVRVAALKGRVLVTVWAQEQNLEEEKGEAEENVEELNDDASKSTKKKKKKKKMERDFETQDVTVPWVLPATADPLRREEVEQAGDEKTRRALPPATVPRFCHVFVRGELEQLVSKLPNVQIVDSYYDNANWAVVLKKIAL